MTWGRLEKSSAFARCFIMMALGEYFEMKTRNFFVEYRKVVRKNSRFLISNLCLFKKPQ